MSDPTVRMIFLKKKIDAMLDDLVKQVPGTNQVEATVALVAVAGMSIKNAPSDAKGILFGTCIQVLSQEAGIRVAQARVEAKEVDALQKDLFKAS